MIVGHPLTVLFYCVQFDDDLRGAIERIATQLVPVGSLGVSAAELTAHVDATLAAGTPLTELDLSERGHSEHALRAFLVALRARLALSSRAGG